MTGRQDPANAQGAESCLSANRTASAVRCPLAKKTCRRSSAGQSAALVKQRSRVRLPASALDFMPLRYPSGDVLFVLV